MLIGIFVRKETGRVCEIHMNQDAADFANNEVTVTILEYEQSSSSESVNYAEEEQPLNSSNNV